jgi:hypothetical protein
MKDPKLIILPRNAPKFKGEDLTWFNVENSQLDAAIQNKAFFFCYSTEAFKSIFLVFDRKHVTRLFATFILLEPNMPRELYVFSVKCFQELRYLQFSLSLLTLVNLLRTL